MLKHFISDFGESLFVVNIIAGLIGWGIFFIGQIFRRRRVHAVIWLLVGLLLFMLLWRSVLLTFLTSSSRYYITSGVLTILGVGFLAVPWHFLGWTPPRWVRLIWLWTVIVILTSVSLLRIEHRQSREKDFVAISMFLRQKAQVSECPEFIILKPENSVQYYSRLPFFYDSRTAQFNTECRFARCDRDRIFFVGTAKEIGRIAPVFPELKDVPPVFCDPKSRLNVWEWRNPLWKKIETFEKSAVAIPPDLPQGSIVEDFETPADISGTEQRIFEQRGLQFPGKTLQTGGKLKPHYGWGWCDLRKTEMVLVGPDDPGHIAGNYTQKVSNGTGGMLMYGLAPSAEYEGDLYYCGLPGGRFSVFRYPGGEAVYAGIMEAGKIYKLHFSLPPGGSILAVSFVSGTVFIDDIVLKKVMGAKKNSGDVQSGGKS